MYVLVNGQWLMGVLVVRWEGSTFSSSHWLKPAAPSPTLAHVYLFIQINQLLLLLLAIIIIMCIYGVHVLILVNNC